MPVSIPDDLARLLLLALDAPLPEYERNRAKVALLLALRGPQALRLSYAGRGRWLTTSGVWEPAAAAGAAALNLVINNPGQWVQLAPRSRRAWAIAIDRARDSLARVDRRLVVALAVAETFDGPGLRLRDLGGQVEVRWRPAPGAVVRVGAVPLPCP